MFQISWQRNTQAKRAVLASFLLHAAVVYLWLDRAPIFVHPSSIAWGQHGKSVALIYFPRAELAPESTHVRLQVRLKHKKEAPQPPQPITEPLRAGSSAGSLYSGPWDGSEAKPAIPLVFPDPTVFPWQLSNGLHGDVIVEVTIDTQGNVTDTRVLQSLRQDIDQKVVATLHDWRFRPATVDGIAISSRQDVHFHFPG